MNKPKQVVRWDVIPIEGEDDDVIHRQSAEGMFVHYADYAALQAENERLNERVRIKFEKIEDPMDEYLNHVLRKNCAKLEAENERLRIQVDNLMKAWLAAKGVQS